MSTRHLHDLAPEALPRFTHFESLLRAAGVDFVRACVFRPHTEQAALYAQGRTTPGKIVTWAKAGQSKHNRTVGTTPASHAADYYPLLNGKLAGRRTAAELALWTKLGAAAVAAGLEWGGHWSPKKADFPHVQYRE